MMIDSSIMKNGDVFVVFVLRVLWYGMVCVPRVVVCVCLRACAGRRVGGVCV